MTASNRSEQRPSPRDLILSGRPLYVLFRLSAPNLAASLIQSTMLVTEGWYAGRLSAEALAGVALVFPIFMLTMMLSAGAIGGAVAGAMARATGAGDVPRANMVLRAAVLIALAAGAIKGVLVLTLGPTLFRGMGGAGAILDAATTYVWMLFPFIWLVWLTNMITGALRGTGDMIRPAICTAVIVVVHGALTVGQAMLGSPLGMAGAALAIVVAYSTGLAYMLFLWTRPQRAVRLSRSGWGALNGARRILGAGLLAGSQSAMTIGYSILATAVFGHLGSAWLAGYGIGARLEMLVVPLIFGIGGAGMVMTGTLLGAGDRAGAIKVGWLCAAASAVVVGTIGGVLAIWPWLWSGLFTSDPEIAAAAAAYLTRVGPFYAFFAAGLGLYFVSQGLETLLLPVIGAALRLVLVGVGFTVLAGWEMLSHVPALWLIAGAMTTYGVFVAGALAIGPWRLKSGAQV